MGLSYKHFLYGAVTFTSLLAALLKLGLFGDTISPPMSFFIGVTYFAFVMWAGGQLYKMHSAAPVEDTPAPGLPAPMSVEEAPSEETLFAAETYISMGENLDTVCMFVNPQYRSWDSSRKLSYQQGLKALLVERSKQHSEPEPGLENYGD